MNKKVLSVIFVIVIGMGAVLLINLTSPQKKEDSGSKPAVSMENERKRLAPPIDQPFGVVGAELPKEPEKKDGAEKKSDITFVGPAAADPEAEAARREADEIRRRKFERDQLSYSSQIMVRRDADHAEPQEPQNDEKAPGSGEMDIPSPDYNPAADRDKEGFFQRADTTQWISPHTREAGRKYEIKTGTVIPGIMISGVNSDLPGTLIAQVSQSVYDTATGRSLLIPQGSRLYGVYDSRVVYGQSRVLIAWNRVIFPDGSSVTLGAMPGADMAGYAGFTDKIDNHYMRIFGSAILMSFITGGMAYAVDSAANTTTNQNGNSNSTTVQDEMTAALAAQLGQATLQMLQKNLNIKPTLEIRPGYQFNITVTKDVVFRNPYYAAH
jgi:type IV secretion system protein VirB10